MPILLTGIKKNNIHLFLAKLEMGWFMPVKIFTFYIWINIQQNFL